MADSTGSPTAKLLEGDAGKKGQANQPSKEVEVRTFPWSAALCVVCTVILAGATVAVLVLGGISDRYYHHSLDVAWHARCSIVLVVQAGTMELCFLISSYLATGIATPDLRPKARSDNALQKHQFGDSVLTLLEYTFKFCNSCYLAQTEGVVMHINPLVPFTRPIYLIRYINWAVAVPTLMLLSNRAFMAKHGDMLTLRRSAPGMVLTSLYCVATWVMEVTSLEWGRWLLWVLISVGYVMACIDQVNLARSVPNVTASRIKFGLLYYQIFGFTAYFIVYAVGYFGFISTVREQSLFSYMDATLKILQGSLLSLVRNYEDLRLMKHWWLESVAARRDFERLVKQARVPVLAVDLQGRVTNWNESMTTLTGFAADKVIGLRAEGIMCEESRECLQQAMSRALQTTGEEPTPGPVEIWVRRYVGEAEGQEKKPEAKPINLVLSFVPRITREGAVDGIVAIGQDLSELSELKAVERQKVQLMAVVSHELRSPLHGMIGLANMLEQQIEGAGLKRQLKMVHSCARRLLDLVTNIMDLSEAEQRQKRGLVEMKYQTKVNFIEVAQEVTMMTSMAVDKSGKPLVGANLKLVNAMGELQDFPSVCGDPYKCTQMVYNLVTNACKFTNKGTVTLRARHVKESGLLEVDVEDTGVGIPEEAQQRIFQPFEQAQTSRSNSYQGMGLGLAVCYSIAQAHGGSISVKSKVGVGSTFTVRLPCEDTFVERNIEDEGLIASVVTQREQNKKADGGSANQPQPANADMSPQAAMSGSGSPRPKGKAPGRKPIILSVDDDEINQEVIQNALAERYYIIRAMNGTEALDHLERCTKACGSGEVEKMNFPDLILLDIQMPGLTGFDVLKELRHKYTSAHIELPVIMVSAKAPMELAAMRSYNDGCTDFLAKPFHTGLLEAKIAVNIKIKEENRESRNMKETETQMEQLEAKAKQAADEAAAAKEEAKAAKACMASMEQKLSKAQQEAKEAAAAKEEARAMKACAASMEQRLGKAQQAAEDALAAKEEAKAAKTLAEEAATAKEEAKAAKASAASMEQELSRVRRELEQSKAAAAAKVEKTMVVRAASPDREEVLKLRKELEEARAALAAAREKAQEAPAAPESTPPQERMASRGEQPATECPPPQAPAPPLPARPAYQAPVRPPSSRTQRSPQTPRVGGDGPFVPWLYQQLQEREDEIMHLNGQLAAQRSASELAAQQMDLVIHAAKQSHCLFASLEAHAHPNV